MKKIVFILEGTSLFVSSLLDKNTAAEDRFFDSISYHLLPFIRMAYSLMEDNVKFKVALSLSPIYCDMLADSSFVARYKESLEKKIEFFKEEKKRLKGDDESLKTLKEITQLLKANLKLLDALNGNFLKAIEELERDGFVELLGTAASYAFLPIYKRMPEVVHAQIQMGRLSYSTYFPHAKLSGFCPPFLGFYKGMDNILKLYGYDYSVVAGSSFLLSKKVPKTGIFAPAITDAQFSLLSTDTNTYYDLVFADDAYQKNEIYLENKSDIGFTLQNREYLLPLFDMQEGKRATGFRYSNKSGSPYNLRIAKMQAKKDAHSFVRTRTAILNAVQDKTDLQDPFSLMLMPSSLLGIKWQEGFIWLEEVLRTIDKTKDMETAFPREVAKNVDKETIVEPFYSSLLDSNYAEELFRQENDWIYRYIFKATERFIAMVDMFEKPSSLNIRTLNQAMREVTLMQSAYWALLLDGRMYSEHAMKHFKSLVKNFTYIYEVLGAGMEETKQLTQREKELTILQNIDYRFYKMRE